MERLLVMAERVKGVHRGDGDNDGAKEKGRREKDRATGGDSILRALPIH